jgi:hypothetical protein
MKIGNWVLSGIVSMSLATCLCAGEIIDVQGVSIPVIEGAVSAKNDDTGATNARVSTYSTDKTVLEVIRFYETFLGENGFIFIGGQENGSFNASVKKGECMFTLRIYSSGPNTILQFIW